MSGKFAFCGRRIFCVLLHMIKCYGIAGRKKSVRYRRGQARLCDLCRAAGVPELAVIRLNKLARPPEEGELLLFPEGRFIVSAAKAGDTPASLCAAYGMRAEEFALFNGTELFPGQEILLRKKE